MRWNYAEALYRDDGATLDDLREAVTTLEDTDRIARRVLGASHPIAVRIETCLRNSRAALRAHEETPSGDVYRAREYGGPLVVAAIAIAIIAWLWRYLTNE